MLEDFRHHFFNVWLPQKAVAYFHFKDPKALPYLSQIVPLSLEDRLLDDTVAKAGFEKIKGKIAAVQTPEKR